MPKPARDLPSARRADPKSERRQRGRPARLSRTQIVDAVLSILEDEPHSVPTIARIAREVEAVPAALYRHFANLDELLDAVITRVFEAGQTETDSDEAWTIQLETWMRGLRAHLLRYPAILGMVDRSGRTSPAWLESSSVIVSILERAGLSGGTLAKTYLWVLETTVGLILQEAARPLSEQVEHARASREDSSDLARERFALIGRHLSALDEDEFFDFAVERAKVGVALLAAGPSE